MKTTNPLIQRVDRICRECYAAGTLCVCGDIIDSLETDDLKEIVMGYLEIPKITAGFVALSIIASVVYIVPSRRLLHREDNLQELVDWTLVSNEIANRGVYNIARGIAAEIELREDRFQGEFSRGNDPFREIDYIGTIRQR